MKEFRWDREPARNGALFGHACSRTYPKPKQIQDAGGEAIEFYVARSNRAAAGFEVGQLVHVSIELEAPHFECAFDARVVGTRREAHARWLSVQPVNLCSELFDAVSEAARIA